jgi:hypothetical protein
MDFYTIWPWKPCALWREVALLFPLKFSAWRPFKKTAADKEENGGGGKRYLRSSYPRHPKTPGSTIIKTKKALRSYRKA